MELNDAIRNRRSIRGYKPDPVPKEVLEKILQTCIPIISGLHEAPAMFLVLLPILNLTLALTGITKHGNHHTQIIVHVL